MSLGRGPRIRRVRAGIAAAALLVFVGALYAVAQTANGESNAFTVGTAILITGYLVFPVLILLAIGLLVIAALLLAGRAMERDR